MAFEGLRKRAMIAQILEVVLLLQERQEQTMISIAALQAQVSALTTLVTSTKTVADANASLAALAIAKLEQLAGAIAAITPNFTQADVDALQAQASGAITELQASADEVAASNAAVQAELDRLATTPAT